MSNVWSNGDEIASKYYGLHGYFICPRCNTKEDDFARFKEKHGAHAGTFTRSKQSMFEEMSHKKKDEKVFVITSKSSIEQLGYCSAKDIMKLVNRKAIKRCGGRPKGLPLVVEKKKE